MKTNNKNDLKFLFLAISACQYISRMISWIMYNFLPSHVPLTLLLTGIGSSPLFSSHSSFHRNKRWTCSIVIKPSGISGNCREMRMSDSSFKKTYYEAGTKRNHKPSIIRHGKMSHVNCIFYVAEPCQPM